MALFDENLPIRSSENGAARNLRVTVTECKNDFPIGTDIPSTNSAVIGTSISQSNKPDHVFRIALTRDECASFYFSGIIDLRAFQSMRSKQNLTIDYRRFGGWFVHLLRQCKPSASEPANLNVYFDEAAQSSTSTSDRSSSSSVPYYFSIVQPDHYQRVVRFSVKLQKEKSTDTAKRLSDYINRLKKDTDDVRLNLDKMTSEREECKLRLKDRDEKIADLQTMLDDAHHEIDFLKDEVSVFESDEPRKRDTVDSLRRHNAAKSEEIDRLEQQLSNRRQRCEDLKKRCFKLETALSDEAAMIAQIEDLQCEVQKTRSEAQKLKDRKQFYCAVMKKMKDDLSQKESELLLLKDSASSIESLQSANSTLQAELKQGKACYDSKCAELEEQRQCVSYLSKQVSRLQLGSGGQSQMRAPLDNLSNYESSDKPPTLASVSAYRSVLKKDRTAFLSFKNHIENMSSRRRPADDAMNGGSDDDDDMIYARKRRRRERNEIEERLENLIVRVGEKSSSSLESNLEGLATVLEADLSNYKGRILEILHECVLSMPQKITIYTTLLGLLNAKNYGLGGDFVDLVLKSLRVKLKQCEWDSALVLAIFLCDLVNARVVSAHSCLSFLDTFIDVTLEEDTPQVRADWYVYCVLVCLPWVGVELAEKKPRELEDMLKTVETYIGRRQKIYVPLLRMWSSARPHPQEEYLDCLWAQVSRLREEKWDEQHIQRPYLAFDSVLCDALQHNLPKFSVPAHQEAFSYPLPKVVFRMFDYTDCPEDGPVLPGAHSIERFLVELELTWIVQHSYMERKDCAAALVAYPRRNKIPLNYMVLEVVFGQLFRLPNPPQFELFFGVLMIELCKLQPNSMPQVLAQAAEMFYQRIESTNIACYDRLVDWFSYHLSQFQFHWSWDDWDDCLKLDELAPRRMFVRDVLLKCLRFSYHQRIVDIVPSDFLPLTPARPQEHYVYGPSSTADGESLPGAATAALLSQAVRNKATPEEALEIIKECPAKPGVDVAELGVNPLGIEVLLSTLLHLGNTSFSHSLAALAKYHYALKELTEGNEEAQRCVLQTVYEHWQTHQQMVVILVDKLLKMQIVECPAVVEWLFSDQMQHQFHGMYVWEIMKSTLVKMSKFIRKLRIELEEAQEALVAKQEEDAGKSGGANGKIDPDGMEAEEPKEGEISADVVEQLEDELEATNNEQKNLFLLLFQKLTIILTQHLVEAEAEGKDYNTDWYRLVTGRMKQIFLLLHDEISRYETTLGSLLFTNDVDPHILEIFHQFCALKR